MNNTLTAQELKTKGTRILKEKTKKTNEAFITIRGKNSFAVLTIEQYNHLRECELEAALAQSEDDIKHHRYTIKSVKAHINDLKHV